MKIFETKITQEQVIPEQIIPAKEIKTFIEKRCDLCGLRSVVRSGWKTEEDSVYLHKSVRVDMEIEVDSNHLNYTSFDICPDCFENKLTPWLVNQGAQPFKYETSGE